MSKLEDKLKASLKPGSRKNPVKAQAAGRASTQPPAKTAPAPVKTLAKTANKRELDLNDAGQPLHPRRIWPD